jgi:hypothetical protein
MAVVCYSIGMTMTRTAKTEAQRTLRPMADGYTTAEFASPRLLAMAKADRGHYRMTPSEYAAHRLGRGQMPECRLENAVEMRQTIHRSQRLASVKLLAGPGRRRARTERRITGLQPGTKRPASWYRDDAVERETKRK